MISRAVVSTRVRFTAVFVPLQPAWRSLYIPLSRIDRRVHLDQRAAAAICHSAELVKMLNAQYAVITLRDLLYRAPVIKDDERERQGQGRQANGAQIAYASDFTFFEDFLLDFSFSFSPFLLFLLGVSAIAASTCSSNWRFSFFCFLDLDFSDSGS